MARARKKSSITADSRWCDVSWREEALEWAAKLAVACRFAQEVRELLGRPDRVIEAHHRQFTPTALSASLDSSSKTRLESRADRCVDQKLQRSNWLMALQQHHLQDPVGRMSSCRSINSASCTQRSDLITNQLQRCPEIHPVGNVVFYWKPGGFDLQICIGAAF